MTSISKYDDAIDLLRTCRYMDRGKPLNVTDYRLHYGSRPDEKRVTHNQQTIFTINSDNLLKFCMPSDVMARYGQSLSFNLHKIVPLEAVRLGAGLYGLRKLGSTYIQEYFCGLTYDLFDGVFVNPKPPASKCVDKEKRDVWLATLKQYKRGLKARIKLGMKTDHRGECNISVKEIAAAMQRDEYPQKLLNLIAFRASSFWNPQGADATDMCEKVDAIFKEHSRPLRQAFGVIPDYDEEIV